MIRAIIRAGAAALLLRSLVCPAFAQDEDFVLPKTEAKIYRDCPTCPQMVVLPNGRSLSRTPVTRAEFGAFVQETKYEQKGFGCIWQGPEIPQGETDPVVCLSYIDATAYLAWLNEKTGKTYRLPRLDEMQYAALAGETTPYWWGVEIGKGRANCRSCGSKWDGRGTAPAGSFKANAFGVADAVGNVWIWTGTCKSEDCSDHYLVGGAWSSSPGDLRVTRTVWAKSATRYNSYGLRIARDDH
jgi:formylglycine-generating enzyme required for sulfatase activity